MDILSLLLSCSLYPHDDTVQSLINVLSNGHEYYITDKAGTVSGMYPETATEAVKIADKIRADNGQPLIGLLAVNTATAASYNATQDTLFDACKNIEVGTAILSAFAESCARDGEKDTESCALGRYADNIGISPKLLQDAVSTNKSARHQHSDDVQAEIPAPERSGIFSDGISDGNELQSETRPNAVFLPVEIDAPSSNEKADSTRRNAESNADDSKTKCQNQRVSAQGSDCRGASRGR